jgi:hypothetical protein
MKTLLQEKLGVPENIIQSSRRYYEDLRNELEKVVKSSNREEQYYFFIKPEEPYKIGDFKTSSIKTTVNITPTNRFDKVDWTQMQVTTPLVLPQGKTSIIDSPSVVINIVAPFDFTKEDILDWWGEFRAEIISTLSHEFKHLFDEQLKKSEKISDRSSYIATRKMMVNPNSALEYLGHIIYFTHLIESLVRPTEILAYLEENKVSKKDFIKFLTDNSTWKKLKELSEFKIEDFKDNVIQNKKLRLDYEVYKLLGADAALLTDKQKVDILLINFYYKIVTEDLSAFTAILKNDNFEWGFEFPENKERALDAHFKRISRFKNEPLKYFDYMEKYINTVSTKLLRKISKLYDLLPNEQKTTE